MDCDVGIGGLVESPRNAKEAPLLAQALEIGSGNTSVCDVAGANNALGFGQGQDTIPRADFIHHGGCYNISVRRDKALDFVTLLGYFTKTDGPIFSH